MTASQAPPRPARCRWCEGKHGDRHLCDPAKQILDALYARGMEGSMPTLEFPDPIPGTAVLADGMVLARQIVIYGALVPVADVPRPALILTGQDIEGNPLPRVLFPASDEELNALAQLMTDMTGMAIRRAAQARGET